LVKNQGACWLLRRAPHSSDSRLPCASKCLECGGCGTGWRSIGVAGVERPGVWEAPAFVGRAKAGFGEAPCNGLEDVLGGSEPAVERSAYEFRSCLRSPGVIAWIRHIIDSLGLMPKGRKPAYPLA
jgi:hypothetical protein